jgi:hypothetical protein
VHNEAVSLNAGGFWRRAFTKPTNDKGKEKKTTSKTRTAAAGGALSTI